VRVLLSGGRGGSYENFPWILEWRRQPQFTSVTSFPETSTSALRVQGSFFICRLHAHSISPSVAASSNFPSRRVVLGRFVAAKPLESDTSGCSGPVSHPRPTPLRSHAITGTASSLISRPGHLTARRHQILRALSACTMPGSK